MVSRREARLALRQQLREGGLESPDFEAACLLEHVLGASCRLMTRQQLEEPLTGEQAAALHALTRRRLKGEPLQYLLGEWEFYGLPFRVGPGVLIPRQDTETLVECALRAAEGISAPKILDLCAGSGCIGIALAHCLPPARITAVEQSADALRYLQENAALNRTLLHIVKGDVLDPALAESIRGVDVIVSNPPYLTEADLAALQKEVQFEPRSAAREAKALLALDEPPTCILFQDDYSCIGGLDLLRRDGFVLPEKLSYAGYDGIKLAQLFTPRLTTYRQNVSAMGQEAAVSSFLTHAGYENIESFPDLAGISRVVSGMRPAGARR